MHFIPWNVTLGIFKITFGNSTNDAIVQLAQNGRGIAQAGVHDCHCFQGSNLRWSSEGKEAILWNPLHSRATTGRRASLHPWGSWSCSSLVWRTLQVEEGPPRRCPTTLCTCLRRCCFWGPHECSSERRPTTIVKYRKRIQIALSLW